MLDIADHGALREIGNGIWTMLGAFLIVALAYTVLQDVRDPRRDWQADRGTALAIGTLVYFLGSIMRSAYIWAGLIVNNRAMDEEILAEWRGLLLLAVGFAVLGGLCIVRICLVDRFGPWAWITAGVVSVAVPVAVYWWV